MIDKGYTKFQNVIITNKDMVINILKDFENLEIENIENYFNYKIIINHHNNLWSLLCNHVTVNIIEKTFICYNIWKSFKHNIIIRADPKITNKIVKEGNIFIKQNSFRIKLYQTFNNSTIIFITGNNKNDILDIMDFITCRIDNYNINMQFIWVDFLYFINTLRYILPTNINIEKEIKIKISNFDNNLIFNKNMNKKRICVIGLSNNFNKIWYYIKKIVFKEKIDNFKNIEYLNIETEDINTKGIKKINKEKTKLISRKIIENNMQIPIYKKDLPDTIYSSSI